MPVACVGPFRTPIVNIVDAAVRRSRERLKETPAAREWLRATGIRPETWELLGLGFEEDGRGARWICYVAHDGSGGTRLGRMPLDDDKDGTAAEASSSIWSSAPYPGAACIVVDGPVELLLLAQALNGRLSPYVVLTRSSSYAMPGEWRDESFWTRFESVTILADQTGGCAAAMAVLGEWPWIEPVVSLARGITWREDLSSLSPEPSRTMEHVLRSGTRARGAGPVDGGLALARSDAGGIALGGFDDRGRLCRALAVEERHVGERGGSRQSLVVARSDGCLLQVLMIPAPAGSAASRRIHALSDGTRLLRRPEPGCATTWSLASAEAYAAGELGQELALDLHGEIERMLSSALPEAADSASVALMILITYVFPAFDRLPLLIMHGGDVVTRSIVARAVASLCYSGRVAGRSRARVLERLADRTGGTLVLSDPGALLGLSGPTEIGRFVSGSLIHGSSGAHEMEPDGSIRALDTFGPRVICSSTEPRVDWPEAVYVCIDGAGPRACRADPAMAELIDRLQAWAMQSATLVREQWRASDGRDVMSWFADFVGLRPSPTSTPLPVPVPVPVRSTPADLIASALATCIETLGDSICLAHLTLEVAHKGGLGSEFTPERIGRWLSTCEAVDPAVPVTRRRLQGQITRIYALAVRPGMNPAGGDPFLFCQAQPCATCRYDRVCSSVLPLLRSGKERFQAG